MNEQSREQQLVSAARDGDMDAFEALVHLYEKRVFALTLRMCGNPEDAAEAAQEAFLAAWQGLAFFRGTPASPPGCTGWYPTHAWTCCGGRAAAGPRRVPPWMTRS